MWRMWRWILAVVPMTLLACSKEPAQKTEASASAAPSTAPANVGFDVEGFCEKTMALGAPRKCEGDDEIIEGNKVGLCTTMLREGREAGRLRFDEQAAKACISAVQGASALPDRRTLHDLAIRFEPCRRVISGKQPKGGECARSMECASELCLDGKCAEPAKKEEACRELKEVGATVRRSSCGDGLACASGKCVPAVAEGGSCKTSDACAEGLHCSEGKCGSDRIDEGKTCVAGDCKAGLYCAEGKCSPKKKAGESCKDSSECRGRCSRKDGRACVSYCGSG